MSDDIAMADPTQASDPEPVTQKAETAPQLSDTDPVTEKKETAAEKETVPETEAGEDKATELPSLGGRENKQPAPFKKPMDMKPAQLSSAEKIDEAKMKAKYGKVKPGGSDFLRKRLNKGAKFFDSGDYNMEKQSGKKNLRVGGGKPPGLAGQRIGGPLPAPFPPGTATGKTIPTPATIPHRKQSTEISKLAV